MSDATLVDFGLETEVKLGQPWWLMEEKANYVLMLVQEPS